MPETGGRSGVADSAINLAELVETLRRRVERLEEELLLLRAEKVAERIDRGEEQTFPAALARRVFVDNEHPIRVFREWRGLTQQQLAELAGTSKNYISQLETGHRRPGSRLLYKIAKALDVPADILCDPDEEDATG